MSALLPGREQGYMHAESKRTVARHLEKLVKNGLLPESALAAVRDANMQNMQDGIPTVLRGRSEYYYKHLPSIFPAQRPSMASGLTLGIGPVSMGRARWDIDGASIFSVEDGKRLAQMPVREPTHYERIRADRIARSQLDTPTVRGMRLLPVFTPGRAFFWGSVMALWGSAAAVVSLGRSLGIEKADDTHQVMVRILGPWSESIKNGLQPLKAHLQARAATTDGAPAERSQFLDRMRAQLR